ncbi:MAG: glycosyltransferase [Bacilli bacterium]|nr:glycosyltransferase [Bacilli bacterium]
MRIVFVLECANAITNGTGATCYRFAKELQKKGHDIVMLGEKMKPGEPSRFTYFGLKHFTFPIFEPLIVKEGFNFVRVDYKTIYEAIKGADLVHLFLPFRLQSVARLIAESLHVPVTCAFHLQPQNITSAIGCGKIGFINAIIMWGFRKYLYDHVRHVHCPSQMIYEELIEHHYRNNVFHVISNGVTPFFHRIEANKPAEFADKIVVTMSGRLSREKRQDVIIKAIARSKYNAQIQLILCGQGPMKKKYEKLAAKKGVVNPIVIRFCNKEELREILSYTDIYVHASDFEIEGISALEAIACGAVPLISDSKLSATSAFAPDPICIFRHGSSKSLQAGIDHFIEYPQDRAAMQKLCLQKAPEFYLDNMVEKMEQMFVSAVEDYKTGRDICQNRLRKKDRREKRAIYKRLLREGVVDEMPEELR